MKSAGFWVMWFSFLFIAGIVSAPLFLRDMEYVISFWR